MSYELLREAIAKQKQVRCLHQGHERFICPHVIGMKNGRRKILAYQFAGGSSSVLPPGGDWRCMFVDDIMSVEIMDGPWHTGKGDSRPQTCVDQIELEVKF